jgi:hypothetical protein
MSVFWETDHYGYDGDFLHGHIKVNYWQDPTKVEAEIDRQLAEIRTAMLADLPRLSGQVEDTDEETP